MKINDVIYTNSSRLGKNVYIEEYRRVSGITVEVSGGLISLNRLQPDSFYIHTHKKGGVGMHQIALSKQDLYDLSILLKELADNTNI